MQACKFSFEDGIEFDGFAHGTTWNGFDNVSITPEVHALVVADAEKTMAEEYEILAELRGLQVGADGLISLANGWATSIVAPPYPKMAVEFPDFDQATLPAIPTTWEDTSWHNEACPAFEIGKVRVFIDFEVAAEREFPECARFIAKWDTETDRGADEVFVMTDDWNEVLAFVLAHQFADTLAMEIGPEKFAEMRLANVGAPDGTCASHDFCDANMPMDSAFTEVVGHELDAEGESEADHALWNAAWEIAKRDRLTATREEALMDEFAEWSEGENMPEGDAQELLMFADLNGEQRAWINDFIQRWEAMREAEEAAEAANKAA